MDIIQEILSLSPQRLAQLRVLYKGHIPLHKWIQLTLIPSLETDPVHTILFKSGMVFFISATIFILLYIIMIIYQKDEQYLKDKRKPSNCVIESKKPYKKKDIIVDKSITVTNKLRIADKISNRNNNTSKNIGTNKTNQIVDKHIITEQSSVNSVEIKPYVSKIHDTSYTLEPKGINNIIDSDHDSNDDGFILVSSSSKKKKNIESPKNKTSSLNKSNSSIKSEILNNKKDDEIINPLFNEEYSEKDEIINAYQKGIDNYEKKCKSLENQILELTKELEINKKEKDISYKNQQQEFEYTLKLFEESKIKQFENEKTLISNQVEDLKLEIKSIKERLNTSQLDLERALRKERELMRQLKSKVLDDYDNNYANDNDNDNDVEQDEKDTHSRKNNNNSLKTKHKKLKKQRSFTHLTPMMYTSPEPYGIPMYMPTGYPPGSQYMMYPISPPQWHPSNSPIPIQHPQHLIHQPIPESIRPLDSNPGGNGPCDPVQSTHEYPEQELARFNPDPDPSSHSSSPNPPSVREPF